jgi:sulfur transfer complex TusBCD TusB component (DsrH family)
MNTVAAMALFSSLIAIVKDFTTQYKRVTTLKSYIAPKAMIWMVQMTRIILLLMRLPTSEEEAERILSIAFRALERRSEAVIYLLGEGVLWSKGLMPRKYLGKVLESGGKVRASSKDLLARAIRLDAIESRIEVAGDLNGELVDDIMMPSTQVISW